GIYNASKTTGMTAVDVISQAGNTDHIVLSGVKAELATINVLRQASGAGNNNFGNVTVNYASGAKADATINIGGAAAHTIENLAVSNAAKVTVQSSGKNATINGTQIFADATELVYIAKDGTVTGSGAITADKVETLTVTADGKAVEINNSSNSFDALKTLNVTATGAKASVYAAVTPTPVADIAISEVNVKGTDATSQLEVSVWGWPGSSNSTTFSAVNFEVNGTSGTQMLLIGSNSNSATIAALNVKAAQNATAEVVLWENGSGSGFAIQGGIFEGKGNITIEGDGTNTNAIDLRNIDRSTLDSASTLTIKLGNNGDVYGTNGRDTIDVATGTNNNITVHFADSLASNGVDTITGFTAGASNDELDFNGFLGGNETVGSSYSADASSADLNLTNDVGENVGLLFNVAGGTLTATKIVTANTSANGEVIMADNAKAVILVTSQAASSVDSANIYYVYDADSSTSAQNWQVELVGTVTFANSGGADLSSDTKFGQLF
ncbi:MAG: hypothetical protein ACK418_25360, partial [Pseudomonas sp.]|uniref:hypothetical protein n=1 Tax=Pseudomonas sp. TaxID=306 RepID=UPI00391C9CE0